MTTSAMIVWRGFSRCTEVAATVERLSCGAGRIACIECGGTGVWDFMVPDIAASPCVECKGTGKTYVSI
jgi:hypothetical protein